MIHGIRNFRLAAGTVSEHLGEAPFVLTLQVLRKLPAGFVRPAARFLSSLAPGSGHPFSYWLAMLRVEKPNFFDALRA